MGEVCPVCSSDEIREVFRVVGERQPLKLVKRCAGCLHEWVATFADDAEWLFVARGSDRRRNHQATCVSSSRTPHDPQPNPGSRHAPPAPRDMSRPGMSRFPPNRCGQTSPNKMMRQC